MTDVQPRETTQMWPVVVFYRLLHIAEINSIKIFTEKNSGIDNFILRRNYTFSFVMMLMEDNLKVRTQICNFPEG